MRKKLFLSLLVCLTYFNGYSVPAYPFPIKYTQPDGTEITIQLKGDERVHWAETTDGYTLLSNGKNGWEYAVANQSGNIKTSGILAREVSKRTLKESQFVKGLSKKIHFSSKQVNLLKSAWEAKNHSDELIGTGQFFNKVTKATTNDGRKKVFTPKGTKKLLMILIQFPDLSFKFTKDDFNNLMNTQDYNLNGAHGSVRDYFREQSYWTLDHNKGFDVETDVVGIYTANKPMAYYGTDGANGSHDPNSNELMLEAVTDANADIDFTQYDNDDDGSVDGVYILYAGYGQASSGIENTIWPHAGGISGQLFDGKMVSKYSCSNELNANGTLTGIGVICHEFGHVCGAPDYYDTDYYTGGNYPGTGDWDIMCGGCYNGTTVNSGNVPSHFNPLEKIKAGWITPITLTNPTKLTIPDITTNPVVYIFNTTTENEYYMMENRQQTGFNEFVNGHGLMIYHYSKVYWDDHANKTKPQGFYPMCANMTTTPTVTSDSSAYKTVNSKSCPFPGTLGKTSFTDTSTPNAKSWAGNNTAKPLLNIAESGGNITLDFISAPTVNPILTFNATGANATQVNLSWVNNAAGNEVIIATNSSATFGTLNDATTYNVGDVLSGGGTIIFKGSASAFNHSGLSESTTYYYQIWAVNGSLQYSTATTASATTACTSTSSAIISEGFESGIPSCWTQEYVSSTQATWEIATTGINNHPLSAHAGSNLVRLYDLTIGRTLVTKLITSPFDIADATNPTLKFWHTQTYWYGQDILKVYYKTSYSDTWKILATYNSSITDWTMETITLPNPSSTYYIAFEGYTNVGYGVCIDDMEVWKDVNATTNTWVGGTSSDWFTSSNWSLDVIPIASLDVIIPSGTLNSPLINASGAICKNITIDNGATLTMGTSNTNDLTINGSTTNNGTLSATTTYSTINITGDWTNNGTFNYGTSSAGSKVNFNGTNSLQTINGTATTDFYILQVKKGSISNILEVTAPITLKATSGNLVLTSGILKISSNSTITPLTSTSLSINSSSGIWNNGGTINPTGKQCNLTGMLKSSAGTSNFSFLLPIGSANSVQIDGGQINITSYFEPYTSTSDIINYTQTGGNLNINSSNTNIPLLITSGSKFIMSGGTISIQKKSGAAVEYQNVAGTSTVTGGTIQIGNSSTTGSPVIRINSTAPIYNLTVNATGTPTAQLVTNPLTVKGDVTIGSGAKIDANSLNLSVNGNWTNNGIGLSTSPTGTVTFNGTASQNIAGNATTFNNFTLNNSNGLTLNGVDATVNGVLTFTSGVIATGNNKLIIPATGSVARTSGHINGFFQKGFATGTNVAKTFEIGDVLETTYKPLDISFNNITNSGYLIGSTTSGDFPQISLSNLNATKSINRYWEVTNSGITFDNYGATFNFSSDDLDASADFSKMYAGKYSSLSGWEYPTISSKTATSVTVNGLTSFSDFIFAEKNIGTDIKQTQNIDFTLSVNANKQIEIALSKYDNNTKVVICNLIGQVIVNKSIDAPKTIVDTKLNTGVYLVSIVTSQKSVCKKIIIK